MVMQDLAQLAKVYGPEDAQTIFSTAGTKIALAGVNDDDAKRFSELSGQRTVLLSSQGDNRQITQVPWTTGGNRGVSETGRALIDPAEVRTLDPDVLIISKTRRSMLARPKPWFRDGKLRAMVPDLARCNPMLDFRRTPSAPCLALPEPSGEAKRHLAELTEDQQTTARHLQEIGERPQEQTAEEQVLRQVELLHEVARTFDSQGQTSGTDLESDQHGHSVGAGPKPLTPKEIELLLAMESRPGSAQAEIGAVLGLKEKSVSRRLTDIRTKLRASKDDDLVRIARERGLLDGRLRDRAEADVQLSIYTIRSGAATAIPDYRHP